MSKELKAPVLLKPVPKQQVRVSEPYRLDLTEYVQNSYTQEENYGQDPSIDLLFSAETIKNTQLPPDLEYTVTGQIYGQLRPPALENSPHQIEISVSNGAGENLEFSFELEVLPTSSPEDEWKVDEALVNEFSDEIILSKEEQEALLKALEEEENAKARAFSDQKQEIWAAILQGQSIPELQSLLDRPITHQEVYYLLSRIAHFVIWNAQNPDPAGPLHALLLKNASEHFHVYDRGSCIVATPKHLFDHNNKNKFRIS